MSSEFEQDYILRQIKNIAGALAKLILNKDTPSYTVKSEVYRSDTDLLHLKLCALLDARKVNEAENLLFEHLNAEDTETLSVAIDFYSRLDDWTDEMFSDCNYSRQEVKQGLISVMKFYRISMDQIVAYFQDEI